MIADTTLLFCLTNLVPITYAWRDELEKKTQNALHRALGNIPPPSRGRTIMSRSGQRGHSLFDGLDDSRVSRFTHHLIARSHS